LTSVVHVPGDKSISHRALLFAALADGPSSIRGILRSHDVHSTAGVLRALGVDVPQLADEITVRGVGRRGMRQPAIDLDCGNSGTTTRLVSGIAAALPIASRFVGDASLSRRPMRRVAEPLTQMGARFEFENGDGLPMTIAGGDLQSVDWASKTPSAQIKSAILFAGLVAGVRVRVTEPSRSRDHTERMLRTLGARLSVEGGAVQLDPTERVSALDLRVPGDPSSAAFLVALAVLGGARDGVAVEHVCLNETRIGFLRALRAMGAAVGVEDAHEESGEPVGTVFASASSLRGIAVAGDQVPAMIDELPLLACVGARADGATEIAGASELRVKESDRIATTCAMLRSFGIACEARPDGFTVEGRPDRPLDPGHVHADGDHRIAMAGAVAGLVASGPTTIDDADNVATSYPGFAAALTQLGASIRVA
jgi:3-phosphoshikimate 1-carboxyvinyltransferase